MDKEKLLRTARALGREVGETTVRTGDGQGQFLWPGHPALPVWLVYGPGGILEKMEWWVVRGGECLVVIREAGGWGNEISSVKIKAFADIPEAVIDAYLRTLDEQEAERLPELPDEEYLSENMAIVVKHIKSLTARLDKLEGK